MSSKFKYGVVTLLAGLAIPGLLLAGSNSHHFGWRPASEAVGINTPDTEGCPIETPDGLSLLFASTRPGGSGGLDIWAADRTGISEPWQPPRNLDMPVNSTMADFCPFPARGRSLFFVSERDDGTGCGSGDIFLSRQSPAGGWSEPQRLPCAPDGPNTAGPERSPSLVETRYGTFLFYSTNGGTGDHDIYVSRMRGDGTFSRGKIVRGLSTDSDDFMPNVRERYEGGFEIVFNSNRPAWGKHDRFAVFGGQDIYSSDAWLLPDYWSPPRNLGANVNTGGEETRATLSGDGTRLHFGRDGDIYVSERRLRH